MEADVEHKIPADRKKFILKTLIPFILREHGRGFSMSLWRPTYTVGEAKVIDGVRREVPSCGMVACIGGSLEALGACVNSDLHGGKALGIPEAWAHGLFYNWRETRAAYGWPHAFMQRYKRASTAIGKAKVAVALLKEVIRTNGECLVR